MPYGDNRTGSTPAQKMACCLMTPSRYLNHCWSSVRSNNNHLGEISSEIPQPSIIKMSFKFLFFKFHWNRPGANHEWVKVSYRATSNMYLPSVPCPSGCPWLWPPYTLAGWCGTCTPWCSPGTAQSATDASPTCNTIKYQDLCEAADVYIKTLLVYLFLL